MTSDVPAPRYTRYSNAKLTLHDFDQPPDRMSAACRATSERARTLKTAVPLSEQVDHQKAAFVDRLVAKWRNNGSD